MAIDIPLARRDLIAQRLARGEAVVATALAVEFQVSEDAVRRDLRALAAEGLCRRVYGGALPLAQLALGARPLAARMDADRERKLALARTAAATVQPGEFVFLDTGSTNLALVECLPEDHDLTVATNSVDIAAALVRRGDLRLLMVGGSIDAEVGGCVDASAVQAVAALNIDRCFLGACALSARGGIGAYHHADAVFKRALLAASQHRVALLTTDKLDARAPHRVAPSRRLDQIVVERDAPSAALAALRKAGSQVLLNT
jgi:DeoR/GlpR family transcriptional regulator of sugar metabolism